MPDWALDLLRSEAVADLAIFVLAVETGLLWRVRNRLRLDGGSLLLNAASGIALLLALRCVLTNPASHLGMALFLALGFFAHIGDVWRRATRTK